MMVRQIRFDQVRVKSRVTDERLESATKRLCFWREMRERGVDELNTPECMGAKVVDGCWPPKSVCKAFVLWMSLHNHCVLYIYYTYLLHIECTNAFIANWQISQSYIIFVLSYICNICTSYLNQEQTIIF